MQTASYEETIRTLLFTDRGSYGNLNYNPVFRASGIFFAVADAARTTVISFLNYWRLKNDNPSVGALLTVRSEAGQPVARSFFQVEADVYSLDLKTILQQQGGVTLPFTGTMEIEFFSDKDMKFAFPAVLVYHLTRSGASFVHTNQRSFNNSEDRRRALPFNRWQTGFDVHVRNNASPFVYLINGPEAAPGAVADIQLFNASGSVQKHNLDIGDLGAYAAKRIDLAVLPGALEFLGSGVGFAKLDVPLTDIYCRFACGIEHADGFVGITHSYFDCEAHRDYYDANSFGPDTYPCFVPVNLIDGLDVDLVFYPILSPAPLNFALQCFGPDGRQAAWIELPERLLPGDNRQVRLDIRKILAHAGRPGHAGQYCIQIGSSDGRIPARVTFGLNYRMGEQPGSNVSSSALLASSHGAKGRAWLWCGSLCAPGARNIAAISHLSKSRSNQDIAEFRMSVYSSGGKVAIKTGSLVNGKGANIEIEPLLAEHGYEPAANEIVWYVIESANPSLIANHVHVSADGRVGADHSF